MIKFKKGNNLKVVAILLSIVFLCNTSLYSCPGSEDTLRVPVGEAGTRRRMKEVYDEQEKHTVPNRATDIESLGRLLQEKGFIEDFDVIKLIGQGSFSAVYRETTSHGDYSVHLSTAITPSMVRFYDQIRLIAYEAGLPIQPFVRDSANQPYTEADGCIVTVTTFVEGEPGEWGQMTQKQLLVTAEALCRFHRAMRENLPLLKHLYDSMREELSIRERVDPKNKGWPSIDLYHLDEALEQFEILREGAQGQNTREARAFLDNYDFFIKQLETLTENITPHLQDEGLLCTIGHGDYNPRNVLLRDGSLLTGILDLDFAAVMPRIADLINLMIVSQTPTSRLQFDIDKVETFILAYQQAAEEPLTDIERKLLPEIMRWFYLQLVLTDAYYVLRGGVEWSIEESLMQERQALENIPTWDWAELATKIAQDAMTVKEAAVILDGMQTAFGSVSGEDLRDLVATMEPLTVPQRRALERMIRTGEQTGQIVSDRGERPALAGEGDLNWHPHLDFDDVLELGLTSDDMYALVGEAAYLIQTGSINLKGSLLLSQKIVRFRLYPSTQFGGFIVCVTSIKDQMTEGVVEFPGVGAEVIHFPSQDASYEGVGIIEGAARGASMGPLWAAIEAARELIAAGKYQEALAILMPALTLARIYTQGKTPDFDGYQTAIAVSDRIAEVETIIDVDRDLTEGIPAAEALVAEAQAALAQANRCRWGPNRGQVLFEYKGRVTLKIPELFSSFRQVLVDEELVELIGTERINEILEFIASMYENDPGRFEENLINETIHHGGKLSGFSALTGRVDDEEVGEPNILLITLNPVTRGIRLAVHYSAKDKHSKEFSAVYALRSEVEVPGPQINSVEMSSMPVPAVKVVFPKFRIAFNGDVVIVDGLTNRRIQNPTRQAIISIIREATGNHMVSLDLTKLLRKLGAIRLHAHIIADPEGRKWLVVGKEASGKAALAGKIHERPELYGKWDLFAAIQAAAFLDPDDKDVLVAGDLQGDRPTRRLYYLDRDTRHVDTGMTPKRGFYKIYGIIIMDSSPMFSGSYQRFLTPLDNLEEILGRAIARMPLTKAYEGYLDDITELFERVAKTLPIILVHRPKDTPLPVFEEMVNRVVDLTTSASAGIETHVQLSNDAPGGEGGQAGNVGPVLDAQMALDAGRHKEAYDLLMEALLGEDYVAEVFTGEAMEEVIDRLIEHYPETTEEGRILRAMRPIVEEHQYDADQTAMKATLAQTAEKVVSDALNNLSPRELEVLKLAAQGLMNSEIVSKLSPIRWKGKVKNHIGEGAVRKHLKHIYQKLGLTKTTRDKRQRAIIIALENNVVDFPDWVRNAGVKLRDILSPREQEVLELVAKAFTSKQIADKLGIKTRTVRIHINSISRKIRDEIESGRLEDYMTRHEMALLWFFQNGKYVSNTDVALVNKALEERLRTVRDDMGSMTYLMNPNQFYFGAPSVAKYGLSSAKEARELKERLRVERAAMDKTLRAFSRLAPETKVVFRLDGVMVDDAELRVLIEEIREGRIDFPVAISASEDDRATTCFFDRRPGFGPLSIGCYSQELQRVIVKKLSPGERRIFDIIHNNLGDTLTVDILVKRTRLVDVEVTMYVRGLSFELGLAMRWNVPHDERIVAIQEYLLSQQAVAAEEAMEALNDPDNIRGAEEAISTLLDGAAIGVSDTSIEELARRRDELDELMAELRVVLSSSSTLQSEGEDTVLLYGSLKRLREAIDIELARIGHLKDAVDTAETELDAARKKAAREIAAIEDSAGDRHFSRRSRRIEDKYNIPELRGALNRAEQAYLNATRYRQIDSEGRKAGYVMAISHVREIIDQKKQQVEGQEHRPPKSERKREGHLIVDAKPHRRHPIIGRLIEGEAIDEVINNLREVEIPEILEALLDDIAELRGLTRIPGGFTYTNPILDSYGISTREEAELLCTQLLRIRRIVDIELIRRKHLREAVDRAMEELALARTKAEREIATLTLGGVKLRRGKVREIYERHGIRDLELALHRVVEAYRNPARQTDAEDDYDWVREAIVVLEDVVAFSAEYALLEHGVDVEAGQRAVIITTDPLQEERLMNQPEIRERLGYDIFIIRLERGTEAEIQWNALLGDYGVRYDFNTMTIEEIINNRNLIEVLVGV
ncbi:MAG: LuxR C-terminal-related transcriptional regulator [Candidatus Omnitrophica bacterium]|nr:LuxR C-terminal-related transcriptional regulator [Candidatus Omnitrophota bacterium]